MFLLLYHFQHFIYSSCNIARNNTRVRIFFQTKFHLCKVLKNNYHNGKQFVVGFFWHFYINKIYNLLLSLLVSKKICRIADTINPRNKASFSVA